MTVSYRPSNATNLEELKAYTELLLKEYADELNARRIVELATVAEEPNPSVDSGMLINNPSSFDPDGTGSKGVFIYVDGVWKRLDNQSSGSISLDSLSDVTIDTPQDGDILVYDGSQFVNQQAVGVPSGSIHAFGTSIEVNGYLICDGRTLLRADYPDLFGVIGTNFGNTNELDFNLPSLEGQFLRSYSTDNSVDPDGPRNIGSTQLDAFQGHWHRWNSGYQQTFSNSSGATARSPWTNTGSTAGSFSASQGVTDPTNGNHGGIRTSTETRSKNVAICYQIKT